MKTKELKDVIQEVMMGTADKGILEEMSFIAFDEGFLISYNDRIAVSSTLPEGEGDFACAVNAKDFINAVKCIRTKDTELILEEGNLIITGGATEVTLPITESEKLKELYNSLSIENVIDNSTEIPDNFNDILQKLSDLASPNLNTFQGLSCVRFSKEFIEATDGSRAGYSEVDMKVPKQGVYIQKYLIPSVIKFNPVAYFFDKEWCHFVNEFDSILSCRRSYPDSPFPEIKELHKQGSGKKLGSFKMTEEFKESIKDLSYFAEGLSKKEQYITMEIKNNKVIFSSSGDKGKVITEIKVKYSGETIRFRVSGPYLPTVIVGDEITIYKNNITCSDKDVLTILAVKEDDVTH